MKRILIAMMVVAVCGLFSACEEDGFIGGISMAC